MAFVVPGVVRYTINGRVGDHNVANVIDMDLETTGSIITREEACGSLCGIILNEWSDHVLNWCCNTYEARSVSWVDLDDEFGSTGERSSTDDHTWPQVGAETQPASPPNTSLLWVKLAAGGRGTRNGRTFIVGVPEAQTDASNPALVTGAFLTARQADADGFLGDVNQEDATPLSYTAMMVVTQVLTRGPATPPRLGPPLTGVGREVLGMRCEQRLATQRRRLR